MTAAITTRRGASPVSSFANIALPPKHSQRSSVGRRIRLPHIIEKHHTYTLQVGMQMLVALRLIAVLGLALFLGGCERAAFGQAKESERVFGAAPALDTIDVRPLYRGEGEAPGYPLYTYLLIEAADPTKAAAAVCAVLHSQASPSGGARRIDPAKTALFYVPQIARLPASSIRSSVNVLANYDSERAQGLLSSVRQSAGIYLVSYLGGPLPREPRGDDMNLLIDDVGGLSPDRLYKYIKEYRLRLAQGGTGWQEMTLRQMGIVVAEQLSLTHKLVRVAGYLVSQALAKEDGGSLSVSEDVLPRQCAD